MNEIFLFENSNIVYSEENKKLILHSYGRIYVFQDVTHNRIKIGFTRKDPIKRIKKIATSCVTRNYNHYVSSLIIAPQKLESIIHKKLDFYKIQGEWFNYDYNDAINIIKKEIQKLGPITIGFLKTKAQIYEEKQNKRLEQLKTMLQIDIIPSISSASEYVSVPFDYNNNTVRKSMCVCIHDGNEYCCLIDFLNIIDEQNTKLHIKEYVDVFFEKKDIELVYQGKRQIVPFIKYNSIEKIFNEHFFFIKKNKHIKYWLINNVGSAFEYLLPELTRNKEIFL